MPNCHLTWKHCPMSLSIWQLMENSTHLSQYIQFMTPNHPVAPVGAIDEWFLVTNCSTVSCYSASCISCAGIFIRETIIA